MTSRRLSGLHHVTAIAGDPQRNVDFYAGVLGLRLVKRTVNFDHPTTYHLYYGDRLGTPGTILTFFAWPDGNPGRLGPGQFGAIGLAIPPASIGYWIGRLVSKGVPHSRPECRFGESVIPLRDPDGLRLELVATAAARDQADLPVSDVEPEHAIRRVHSVSLWEHDDRSAAFLTDHLGFRAEEDEDGRRRLVSGEGETAAAIDLVRAAGFWEGAEGTGTIHHVAWRAGDDASQAAWRDELEQLESGVTPVRDRFYFRSIYFNEPGGALLELTTDEPGFTVDEPPGELGASLKLPPWYEEQREYLSRFLPPIHLPGKRQPFANLMDEA
jgi:catechol 2,3-dioxygenase-like lactoylglutathione lyase family enzyme